MDYKKELEEALDHIDTLQEALSWVGGDPYEVDCVDNMTKGILEFLDKHRPTSSKIEGTDFCTDDKRLGIYCLKDNPKIKTKAVNKRNAKNILNVKLSQVKCIKPPEIYYNLSGNLIK